MVAMEVSAEIQILVVSAAWHAANKRSLLWGQAAEDKSMAEEASLRLAQLLSEEQAATMKSLCFHSAWYAANTRRFVLWDAQSDRQGANASKELLVTLMQADLANLISDMAKHASWHAANSRSMLWQAASKDLEMFEDCVTQLDNLLAAEMPDRPPTLERSESDSFEQTVPLERTNSELERSVGYLSTKSSAAVVHFDLAQDCDSAPDAAMVASLQRPISPGAPSSPASSTQPRIPRSISTNTTKSTQSKLQRTKCVLDDVTAAWQGVIISSEGVDAASFIAASYATVLVFEVFGKVLSPVQADMRSNVDIIHKNTKATPNLTLEQMVDRDATKAGSFQKAGDTKGTTTLSLVWLLRFERLLDILLATVLENRDMSLSACIYKGYEGSLKKHHGWLTQKAIGAAILAAPSRSSFVSALSSDPAHSMSAIGELLQVYSPVLNKLHTHFVTCGLETLGS